MNLPNSTYGRFRLAVIALLGLSLLHWTYGLLFRALPSGNLGNILQSRWIWVYLVEVLAVVLLWRSDEPTSRQSAVRWPIRGLVAGVAASLAVELVGNGWWSSNYYDLLSSSYAPAEELSASHTFMWYARIRMDALDAIVSVVLTGVAFGMVVACRETRPRRVEAETKRCPDCAEDVKAAATVCRFCGYAFENQGQHHDA